MAARTYDWMRYNYKLSPLLEYAIVMSYKLLKNQESVTSICQMSFLPGSHITVFADQTLYLVPLNINKAIGGRVLVLAG